MTTLKNRELQDILESTYNEENITTENTHHLEMLRTSLNEVDTYLTAFEQRGIYELTDDNDLSRDADVTMQEEIEFKICESDDETLQDLVTEFIYDSMQEIRDIAQNFQEKLINLEKLKKTLEAKEKEFGKEDDSILLREAYHACAPDRPFFWMAEAVRRNDDGTYTAGRVWWDFEAWIDENGDRDDASSYPWEENGEFDATDGTFDITETDELDAILDYIK